MPLDPDIAAQVAHLFDATLAQVLSGEVPGPPAAAPMVRNDVAVVDATVAGAGGPVPIRCYRAETVPENEPVPALVWAHGGGWQYGDLDMPEAHSVAQVVAATLPGVVVSVDYRLAPRHRYPAALDDVVAVVRWASSEGRSHGIDPERVALGGASAGATLAAGAALALRDADPRPAALLLAYPVTDPVGGPYGERHPDCPPLLWLDRDATVGLFARYIDGDPAAAGPPAVPAEADPADLAGLPPLLVTTAEVDALTPQARRFADLAEAAGISVYRHHVDGLLHGYLNTVGGSPSADHALARHVLWLAEQLRR